MLSDQIATQAGCLFDDPRPVAASDAGLARAARNGGGLRRPLFEADRAGRKSPQQPPWIASIRCNDKGVAVFDARGTA